MEIDLNADLGEGFGIWRLGDDEALLDVVTSANVACGFHAGDPATIRRTCAAAVDRGVSIGAQVSYRDLAGFGRREMEMDPEDLCAEVLYQLAAVDGIARAMGGRVSYVKPHGALYNRICRDPEQAAAVVAAVADYDQSLPVLSLPGSAVHEVAAGEGLTTVAEAFADRAYTPAGALVPRRSPGAVLHDPDTVAARAVRMATARVVTAVDGSQVPVEARSICVHGDTPGAVRLARAVREGLTQAGVTVRAFA
ncbi:LamB/YcsF family protein [Planomonospora sp. ID67723]|uniref:LamB/YcsF family protein n=1 Tax=Planomonospora sp. ID67723 TaxID=2738134 RepID=UPI0018C3D70C|nr:5-oxoprolinase subunit PxpA [Planomonospora sp. ID67723]MBG0830595.1 LamB/YcsF family protein [Planomonospora sp. ID67723]